ncbi:hypothetical protein PAXINDRAFT_82827, partial [Paxillus involutus ATCC 200175]
DDGKKFSIIDVVISFGGRECFREVGAGVEFAVNVSLHENSSSSMKGGISHDEEWFRGIGELKDRGFHKKSLEFAKGGFAIGGPIPRGVLLGEIGERFQQHGKGWNESTVEVAES